MIKETQSNAHWIFFTAIEQDAETLLRFIEPTVPNFQTYSLEICRVLFAAAAEFEVVVKGICAARRATSRRYNMDQLRKCIMKAVPEIATERVFVGRYGLELDPLLNWRSDTNPEWWQAYNSVKHDRTSHFSQGHLRNALNAVAGLMVATVFFYRHEFAPPSSPMPMEEFEDTVLRLSPRSRLFSFDASKRLKIYLRG